MKDNLYLDHTFKVTSCDMDIFSRLKPTAILNICGEVAYMHSSLMGFGFESLAKMDMAWVLSRVETQIERLPTWGEQIRVRTWHKRFSGLFGIRDYIFFDNEDREIIRVTTSWVIIKVATRRIVRIDRLFAENSILDGQAYPHEAIATEAQRISLSDSQTHYNLGEHLVQYSDMDLNRHVNNAKYLEWACDHSKAQMDSSLMLSSFAINFNHEATYNQTVALIATESTPESLTVEGVINKGNIFALKLNYRKTT